MSPLAFLSDVSSRVDWGAVQTVILSLSGIYFGWENRGVLKSLAARCEKQEAQGENHEVRIKQLEAPVTEVSGFTKVTDRRRV